MKAPMGDKWTGVSRSSRPLVALGRWSRDARTPSLRLRPSGTAEPKSETTAELPVIPGTGKRGSAPPQWGSLLRTSVQPVTRLRDIKTRKMTSFASCPSACPYLEYRSSNRRCLSAEPAPVSLERQVRYCLTSDHRQCKYYRKARGLYPVPPTQAAFYTAAAVTLVILIVLAGVN